MMKFAPVVAIAALCAGPALAVELTGGDLTLGYSTWTDDTSFAKLGVAGSAEIGFSPEFSVQGDLGTSRFLEAGETTSSIALHAIYHTGPGTSLGVFYGTDSVDNDNKDFYGFEVGQKSSMFEVEAHIGNGENFDLDGMVGGLSGTYNVTPVFGLGASYQRANIDGLDISTTAIRADYEIAPTFTVGAEIGSFRADLDNVNGRETYIGLSATKTFGPQDGATFGRRGILNVIPGL